MATGTYAPDPDLHVVDANGVPVSGGLVWTYIAGTTTPTPTYTDVTLLVPNTNPIVAGSDGRFVAFLAGGNSYKFVYETPAVPPAHGAVLATRDNILAVTTITPGSAGGIVQYTTLTGVVNDFALIPGCSVLYCNNNTAPLTITGFSGGVPGQRLTVIGSTSQGVSFAYQSSASLAQNRLLNWVGSAPTPLAPSVATYGSITYIYAPSSNLWQIVAHDQGDWIVPPFNAADYLAPWVVASSDVGFCQYRLSGRQLTFALTIGGGSSVPSPTTLQRRMPGGFTPGAVNQPAQLIYTLSGSGGFAYVGASALIAFAYTPAGAPFPAGGPTTIQCILTFAVA